MIESVIVHNILRLKLKLLVQIGSEEPIGTSFFCAHFSMKGGENHGWKL